MRCEVIKGQVENILAVFVEKELVPAVWSHRWVSERCSGISGKLTDNDVAEDFHYKNCSEGGPVNSGVIEADFKSVHCIF